MDGKETRGEFMKRLVQLIAAVLLLNGAAHAQVQNPDNGHFYQAVAAPSGGITWAQAKATAENMVHDGDPGHLVTITSAAEQSFVTSSFPVASSQNYWIGGFQPPNNPEPAGGFRWVTGEPWNYTAWNSGEPNNADTDNLPQDAALLHESGREALICVRSQIGAPVGFLHHIAVGLSQ